MSRCQSVTCMCMGVLGWYGLECVGVPCYSPDVCSLKISEVLLFLNERWCSFVVGGSMMNLCWGCG